MGNHTMTHVIMTGFLLLFLDRIFALYLVQVKSVKAIKRAISPSSWEVIFLAGYVREFAILVACLMLFFFGVLSGLQIAQPQTLANEIGKTIIAGFIFSMSALNSILNVFVERIT